MTDKNNKAETLIYLLSSTLGKGESAILVEALEIYQKYITWRLSAKNMKLMEEFFAHSL